MRVRLLGLVMLGLAWGGQLADAASSGPPPNVLLILTDDQGYGDVGYNGNPVIQTPVLDALARRSAILDPFYVTPVCTLTRAALLTGRHASRAGVLDYGPNGRSMLYPDEWTMGLAFQGAGYATAIFGKWHLGDSAPLRPGDRGFHESLVIRAGMMGGENALPGQQGYFDPTLTHNGVEKPYQGYCNDIYTGAALDFIEAHRTQPFFVFYSTNVPHHPLIAPREDEEFFLAKGLSPETARYYGMIRNVDRNVGRMLDRLREWQLLENTIIIFLGDNGTSSLHSQKDLYDSGLRGRKTHVYEGGVRVPCLLSWPGHFVAGKISQPTSVLDLMPTLLEVCRISPKKGVEMDGVSLVPLLTGANDSWTSRNLYQNDRTLLRHFSVRDARYKLVCPGKALPDAELPVATFELYDLNADPGEKNNIAAKEPEVVNRLAADYEKWYASVVAKPSNRALPRIRTDSAVTVVLTGLDKRGVQPAMPETGRWDLAMAEPGLYNITLRLRDIVPIRQNGEGFVKVDDVVVKRAALMEEWIIDFTVPLAQGPASLEAWVELGGRRIPLESVTLRFHTGEVQPARPNAVKQ